ncbi:unnamed protein product [Rotaria sordida]|uniref:G-protein coupled receptors family 1 profile domain-containing protein n=1 Tax=Rotaria sordida TaxID=392033 RepID=A0A814CJI2_9BILA|nr:unnamed protein product [Rotaria sordida]
MERKEDFFTSTDRLNSSISSSTLDENLNQQLKTIIIRINFYFGIIIYFFGILGNTLNILILSQRSLRSNTCIMIFLASSITGIITILFGLTSRMVPDGSGDIADRVRWICKIRAFIVFTCRSATFWLIMLATFDRWAVSSTNPRFRQLCSTKNVLRYIFFIIIISIIIHCQYLYCYESDVPKSDMKCFNKNVVCQIVNGLLFAIVTIILPLILIAIFGLMTILKIRSSRSHVIPVPTVIAVYHPSQTVDHQQRRFKRTDRHLFIILFVQVILLAFLTIPMAVQQLYITITTDKRSNLQETISNLSYHITLLMTYTATGMQFYVNTLSGGRVFRKAIIDLRQLILQKIICR